MVEQKQYKHSIYKTKLAEEIIWEHNSIAVT